jgi:hypothetical protein
MVQIEEHLESLTEAADATPQHYACVRMPIRISALAISATARRTLAGVIAPMQPTRNVGSAV